MNLINLLENIVVIAESKLDSVPITGITKVVTWLIEKLSFGGYVAVGIIFFTLLLKILPLPLDIFSRASTKKNALKMEKMRPELERLQKQYANNKELYNKKMMALYKKEGYSTFAACLPTIFTLVFFIIVIGAFNRYSTYTNMNTYIEMARAYNEVVIEELDTRLNDSQIISISNDDTLNDRDLVIANIRSSGILKDDVLVTYLDDNTILEIKNKARDAAADRYFEVIQKSKFFWVKNIWIADLPWKHFITDTSTIKTYSKGCSSTAITNNDLIDNEYKFTEIISSSKLDDIKKAPNGYLVLVVLSIGIMLLSQLITNKTQKAQMELQSVDGANGQAATTQKMMMWMMPIMFGIFSFMYSAAFSIYIIISTLFSTGSTVIINKIVEARFMKKMLKEEESSYQRKYGHLLKSKDKKDEENK